MGSPLVTAAVVLTVVLAGGGGPGRGGDDAGANRPAMAGPAADGVSRAAAARPEGVWPLSPRPVVVSRFDPPETRWGAGHRGVDLAGRVGQGIGAALPGRVSFAARIAGRGVVVVDHGTTRTTYEPVVADVAVGDRVAAGGHLGRLELVGSHCLPLACLHWGWRRGDVYLDPLGLVGAAPVRLLPLGDDLVVPVLPSSTAARPGLRPGGAPAGRPP